jgi:hypothetical protein
MASEHVPVEVRNRYDGQWVGGFSLVERGPGGCRVLRLSDGVVLPAELPTSDVRLVDGLASC